MSGAIVYEYVIIRCQGSGCGKKIKLKNLHVTKGGNAISWRCPSCGTADSATPINIILSKVIEQKISYREYGGGPVNAGLVTAVINVTVVDPASYDSNYPHTFRSLQKFVMALAAFRRNRGKTGFFGADKGVKAEREFEDQVTDLIIALRADGQFGINAEPSEVEGVLSAHFNKFVSIYPNWSDSEMEFRSQCSTGNLRRLIGRAN
jgi:hypothetical protein